MNSNARFDKLNSAATAAAAAADTQVISITTAICYEPTDFLFNRYYFYHSHWALPSSRHRDTHSHSKTKLQKKMIWWKLERLQFIEHFRLMKHLMSSYRIELYRLLLFVSLPLISEIQRSAGHAQRPLHALDQLQHQQVVGELHEKWRRKFLQWP